MPVPSVFASVNIVHGSTALTAFDCVRGSGPAYLRDLCIPVADISLSGQTSIWLNVETWCCDGPELGRRSFHVAAPVVWNALRSTSISRGHLELGWKLISLTKLTTSSENTFVLRVYSYCTFFLTYLLTYLLTYILTYLLRSGADPKIEWVGAGAGAGAGAERWAGVTEKGVSGERKFLPLPLRSHALKLLTSSIRHTIISFTGWNNEFKK